MMQRIEHETDQGMVYLEGPCPGEYLAQLKMNDKLSNFRPPDKQKSALVMIANMDRGMMYIARHEDEIIGYVTFHPSDDSSRWSKHPRLIELGGIEISSDWRRFGVAKELLKFCFANPVFEDLIVITMEMCWHWDTRRTNLDIWEYQRVLTNLFGSVGMQRTPTDDPDIMEHAANVLMTRIGKNVSTKDIVLFDSMKFLNKNRDMMSFL